MTTPSLLLTNAPTISDQTASEMLDLFYQFMGALEDQYGDQLQRLHHPPEIPQPDLFEDLDDLDEEPIRF